MASKDSNSTTDSAPSDPVADTPGAAAKGSRGAAGAGAGGDKNAAPAKKAATRSRKAGAGDNNSPAKSGARAARPKAASAGKASGAKAGVTETGTAPAGDASAAGGAKPAAKPSRAATRKPATARSARAKAPQRSDTRTTTHPKAAQAPKPAAAAPAPATADAPNPQAPNPQARSAAMPDFSPVQADSLAEAMALNVERIEGLTQRLMAALARRPLHSPAVEAPGPELYLSTAQAWAKLLAEQPARILEQQISYWGDTLKHYAQVQQDLAQGRLMTGTDTDGDDADGETDKRFANPLWRTHPFFDFVRKQYKINSEAMLRAAAELNLPDETARRRVEWFTRQLIDMMAPTNFLATNPDALQRAIETEGASLIRGLENLVRDVEANGGEVIVSLADRDAFEVGQNIGASEGRVVARSPLYELIQYSPTTEQVHATPVVIFPPWINKFYILDLKPQNSLIKWIVDQGFTLFVVSWKNPDLSYADTGMDQYVSAYLSVMDQVLALTGQDKLNAVGYCIAGTTLALTLALMKARGDDRVNSATFFTTLTDFSDQGEFTPYLQNDFVDGLAEEVARAGILPAQLMTRTFSFLRANDLVWGPAIRSYLMGEAPPAFDLLYWNGDGTNLPGRMAMEYLRGLCQDNRFAGDGFTILGQQVRLRDVTLPLCAIACETDHIAPWRQSWLGVSQMGSPDKQFILSESGHIAGIVNPPSKKKYGHYTSDGGFDDGPEGWRDTARFHPGSWWPRWSDWLAGFSGPMVPARQPDAENDPAPGRYVHEKL